jgi:hypothetical protein
MNDKDFDNYFAEQLKRGEMADKPLFVDKQWDFLTRQLDAYDLAKAETLTQAAIQNKPAPTPKLKNWILGSAGLLALLSVGLNGWLLGSRKSAEQPIKVTVSEQAPAQSQSFRIDTVYIEKHDTIFIQSRAQKSVSSFGNSLNRENGGFSGETISNNKTTQISPVFAPNALQSANATIEQNSSKTNSAAELSNTETQSLVKENNSQKTAQVSENQGIASLETSENIAQEKETRALNAQIKNLPLPFLANITPMNQKLKSGVLNKNAVAKSAVTPSIIPTNDPLKKRFVLGVNYGLVNYKTSWLVGQGTEVFKNIPSYVWQVRGGYKLTKNWQVGLSAAYCPLNLQIRWSEKRYHLPELQFNYQTHKHISTEFSQKMVLVSSGFKYIFAPEKRFNAQVSASYSAMRILPFEANFLLKNLATNSEEIVNLPGESLNFAHILELGGGLEYRLRPWLTLQAEGFYFTDMVRPRRTFDLLGLRTGFSVNF